MVLAINNPPSASSRSEKVSRIVEDEIVRSRPAAEIVPASEVEEAQFFVGFHVFALSFRRVGFPGGPRDRHRDSAGAPQARQEDRAVSRARSRSWRR